LPTVLLWFILDSLFPGENEAPDIWPNDQRTCPGAVCSCSRGRRPCLRSRASRLIRSSRPVARTKRRRHRPGALRLGSGCLSTLVHFPACVAVCASLLPDLLLAVNQFPSLRFAGQVQRSQPDIKIVLLWISLQDSRSAAHQQQTWKRWLPIAGPCFKIWAMTTMSHWTQCPQSFGPGYWNV
jgi:hypothetical protein